MHLVLIHDARSIAERSTDEENQIAVKHPYSDITKQQTENQQTTTPPLNKSANEKVVSLARVDTKDMLEQLVRHKQTNLKHFENEPKTTPPLSNRLVKLLVHDFTAR